jgi:hypothetical protein
VSRTGYLGRVKQFIDIAGASGSIYRFQRIGDPGLLPARGGNFVFSREAGERNQVICCGTARSLARAGALWINAVEEHQAAAIFVRLNVSRIVRASEHDDIVEGQKPTVAMADID